MLEEARERVAAASRRVAAEGLVVGTAGNVSERADELLAITPTGADLKSVTADQVAIVDMAGEQLDGELIPTSELELHLAIYREYAPGAIVHTHSPVATAISCVFEEVPVVHYHVLLLGGAIRVAPYATFGTPELARLTLEALRERTAALMANHGAVTFADDLDSAVERSLLLEWACRVYWYAASAGTPRILTAEEEVDVTETVASRRYGQLQRHGGHAL
jgi:L-fuculose-phosphate aldolase